MDKVATIESEVEQRNETTRRNEATPGHPITLIREGQQTLTTSHPLIQAKSSLGPRPVPPTSRNLSASQVACWAKKRKCGTWCDCSCHSKGNYKMPWALSTVLGELDVRYNGCRSNTVCDCIGDAGIRVTYKFPRYLVERYISVAISHSKLAGPEFLLRVPRVMPWTHILWRYSVSGDVFAIQRMYQQGLASPSDINPKGESSLTYAVDRNTSDLTQFLLDQGVDPEHGVATRTPSELIWDKVFAGQWGDNGFAIVRRMLKDDGCIDKLRFSTLHNIILGFIYKDLRTVLEATTDTIDSVDFRGRTPLFWAVVRDDEAAVDILLEYHANPNIEDRTGYVALDWVRSVGICKSLLKAGATSHINKSNYDRQTLHQIIRQNPPLDLIDCLFDAGFGIDVRDADDETPLLNAIYKGYTEVAEHLIKLGADVDATNKSSRDTAVLFAASFDRTEILECLLQKGAIHTTPNRYGRDLGHCVARFAGTDLIRALIPFNLERVDLTVRDHDGKSAKELMNERIIFTDQEVGVHEAFDAWAASLPRPVPQNEMVGDGLQRVESDLQCLQMEGTRLPGIFPCQRVTDSNYLKQQN